VARGEERQRSERQHRAQQRAAQHERQLQLLPPLRRAARPPRRAVG
jgi:hypothetical protein